MIWTFISWGDVRVIFHISCSISRYHVLCCPEYDKMWRNRVLDRDWIMELAMEADILTVTGILTPEGASVESCFPFDITISQSWFPLPCLHETPLYHRGRETSSWFWAVTLVTLKIQMYTDGYRICILRVTIGGYRITARYWQHGLTSLDRPRGLAGVHRSGHDLFPRINKKRLFWLKLDKMIRRCN